jgi:hypothetical protein
MADPRSEMTLPAVENREGRWNLRRGSSASFERDLGPPLCAPDPYVVPESYFNSRMWTVPSP